MKKQNFHIPIFVPHKGCPHDCVFCNQRKITGRINEMTARDAEQIIEEHLKSIEGNRQKGTYHVEIAFFGGSFTAIDIDKQTELLKLAYHYVKLGRVDGIRLSTRPDAIDAEILSNCKRYGVCAIELGVQSADRDVLKASDRGHSFDDVVRASQLIHSYSIELGLQMMTGLPCDSYEKSIETARKIISLNPKAVRIYPTLVMDGTRLMDMYKDGSYKVQTTEDAVKLCADIADMFMQNNIEILRISLQTTDGVNKDTVIGPYHPAFAELVYSELERRRIEDYIIKNKLSDCLLKISTEPQKISRTIGHMRSNKIYFKEKYGIDLKVIPNSENKTCYFK